MKILEFHRGNTRNVILLFPLGIALKFPRFDLFKALRSLIKVGYLYARFYLLKEEEVGKDLQWNIKWVLKGHYERSGLRCVSYCLFRGIMANRNEYEYFQEDPENPFLIPTYFSLFGFVNAQPIVKPIENFSVGLYHKICLLVEDRKELHNFDSHAWEDGNFTLRADNSVALYDYGSSRAWPFVKKYGRQFSKILQTT